MIVHKKYTSSESFQDTNFDFEFDNNKMRLYDECKFSGSGFNDDFEIGECSIAHQIIKHCNNVIEIGGGTGKVSHAINSILQKHNKGSQHIVIEPGVGGTGNHGNEHIYINKKNFNDQYTILKKFANDLTFEDLEILNSKPDCLYVDCEGCLHDFQKTKIGKFILKNVRFIVNEMDGHNNKIIKQWRKSNFKKIGEGYGCGTNCSTYVMYKKQ